MSPRRLGNKTLLKNFCSRLRSLCSNKGEVQVRYFHDQPAFPHSEVGQPCPATHPHLLKAGELLPGISGDEFKSRRNRVGELMVPGSVMLLGSSPVQFMAGIVPYPFRQNADFLYLTGCNQPGAMAMLERPHDSGKMIFKMFMPSNRKEAEVWDGKIGGVDAALDFFGADEAYPIQRLENHVAKLSKSAQFLYYEESMAQTSPMNSVATRGFGNPKSLTHPLRWKKSESEISLMQKSASIACQAFLRTMCQSHTLESEHQLRAIIEYECKVRGAQHMAFPSVVASGEHASTIHYSRADALLRPDETVLVDAGCEYFGHVSDITRVWSPRGEFSQAQREVYEEVLEVQKKCIEMCVPGNTLGEIHRFSIKELSKSMSRLQLFKMSPLDISKGAYLTFYPTSVGHWLGLDTHDCSLVDMDTELEPGVVLTIEPGMYIPKTANVPQRYRGIGVRIEDDILITGNGHQVLTASVPKEVSQLEGLVRYCTL